jgi:lipoprotein-releasing system permease protein
MNLFPLYIAKRYLFSRKRHNAINWITGISAFGVMGGSIAFILVLSVFNGFEGVVLSLFNAFHADLRITAVEGKTFTLLDEQQQQIRDITDIVHYQEVVEEIALLRFRDNQHLATLKGVGNGYQHMTGLDTLIYAGDYVVSNGRVARGVLGAVVAYRLGAVFDSPEHQVEVYMANRFAAPGDMLSAFTSRELMPSGLFSVQQEIDNKYAIVPVEFMRDLLDYDEEMTSLELGLHPDASPRRVKQQLETILGEDFRIQDKYEQQELLYRIIRSERWAIFAILVFILLLAVFNVIGSLTMLILEKKKDIAVMQSMGASNKIIRRVFLIEGIQISFIGVVLGLLIGGVIAWLQQHYGLVSIGASDTLVIDAYPVKLHWADFMLIFGSVMGIGLLAAWLPVRKLSSDIVDYKL